MYKTEEIYGQKIYDQNIWPKKVPQRLQKLELSYRYDYESLDLVKHSSGSKCGFNLIPHACEHTHSAVSIWNEQSPLYKQTLSRSEILKLLALN